MNHVIEALIRENPPLHAWAGGEEANWSVAPEVLRFIGEQVAPGMKTLETGAGQTTIAFAAAGAEHTAITLDTGEADRVRAWCASRSVSSNNLSFIFESSEVALPRGQGFPEALDFVFIDGAHRFPMACLDWHYTQARLKVDGIMGVDDYTMPSVRVLYDFLLGEDEWSMLALVGRTAFFRRIKETIIVNDCQGQRMNKVAY